MSSVSNFWEEVKAFFKYSETIFVARLTMFFGFLSAAVGAMDWSPIYNVIGTDPGFTQNQAIWLGMSTFAKGLLDEFVRRRNSTL